MGTFETDRGIRNFGAQSRTAKVNPKKGVVPLCWQQAYSEQEQEREPPNADSTGEAMPNTPGIESEDTLPATIECGLRRSQSERRRP